MAKKAAKNDEAPNLEKALEELEQLIQHMEEGEISLEESLQCFERGIKLTRSCQEALKAAEHKVQILLEQNGEVGLEDFEAENGG